MSKIISAIQWPFLMAKKFSISIMDFFKDLLNQNSTISSMRFWRLIVILNITVEWQHAIWFTAAGIWMPSYIVLAFAASVLGLSMFQKNMELMNKHGKNNS